MKTTIIAIVAAATLTSAVPLLQPRSNSGKMTYYAPGLGACGATNTNADMIVAVPSIVYGTYANPNSSPVCKKTVTITAGNTSVKAAITDRCAGCGASDIDVSPAVFKKFGDESLGKIAVTWVIN